MRSRSVPPPVFEPEPTLAGWKKASECRYDRDDGAAVIWDDRTPYANPCLPNCRMWTVWEPDPGQGFLSMSNRRSRFRRPRRFKTPEAAMLACELEWPRRPEKHRITHVAIRFGGKVWSLPRPNRHHHVIRHIAESTGVSHVDSRDRDQGFLDQEGRYLDRKQALEVAREAGQLRADVEVQDQLYSENLW